jgi:pimeloyl-ACP methyl ester carboxylesterase
MEDRLPLVRCPALLLYCSGDPFATPERAGALRAAFRPCDEATIEGGVFAANENPGGYAAAVLEYLKRQPPA